MTVSIHRFEDEPILLVTYEGLLDVKLVEIATTQIDHVLEESDVPLYGIIDLRGATSSMGELMRLLARQSRGAGGARSSDCSRVVLVGAHPLIRIYRRLFQHEPFGGLFIPVFSTLDDAIAAQRARIRADAQR